MANKRVGRMPKKNVEAVRERSKGKCEGCHMKRGTDIHHRKPLGRGGDHNIANLVLLCGGDSGLSGGNHSGCHGLAHSGDAPEGWLISTWETRPESALMFTDLMGTVWSFDTEGEKHVAPGGRPF